MLTWAVADYSMVYHVARCTLVVTTALITNYCQFVIHTMRPIAEITVDVGVLWNYKLWHVDTFFLLSTVPR